MVLLDVDPEYFGKPEEYLPKAKNILQRQKLDWPNALAPHGFTDTMRVFNLSGYGTVAVDAGGIVRGVNLHGKELEGLIEGMIMEPKKADKRDR